MTASEVARPAGIHSQLFRWRKDLCDRVDAGLSQLVPVEIVPGVVPPAVEVPASPGSPGRRRRKSGIIEIERGGGRRVRVDRDVDAKALRRVLDALGSRNSGSERRAGVAGDQPHRHEEGHSGPGAGGAGDAEALSAQWSPVRLPRPPRRPNQGSVARRPWWLPARSGWSGGCLVWPLPADGVVTISSAQLGYLLEGIDWRMPRKPGGRRRRADDFALQVAMDVIPSRRVRC